MSSRRNNGLRYLQKNMGVPGAVYVLSNAGLRPGVHKVGCTRRTGFIRAYEMNKAANTGTPGEFNCVFECQTLDCGLAEQRVQQLLCSQRIGKEGQEYYDVPLEGLKSLITEVCVQVDAEKTLARTLHTRNPEWISHAAPSSASVASDNAKPSSILNAGPNPGPQASPYVSLEAPHETLDQASHETPCETPCENHKVSTPQPRERKTLDLSLLTEASLQRPQVSRSLLLMVLPVLLRPPVLMAIGLVWMVIGFYGSSRNTGVSLANVEQRMGSEGVIPALEVSPDGVAGPQSHQVHPASEARIGSLDPEVASSNMAPGLSPPPDWSQLSPQDAKAIDAVCSREEFRHGPLAYRACLRLQVRALKDVRIRPDESALALPQRMGLQSPCLSERLDKGFDAHDPCLSRRLLRTP